ncbi:MAG: histidine phosphatase family protein [Dokdonella sp.]|uniref:histidine phosphatase family protein n=1 Tax=Dokdonella sp. TaxID=2291710 RepID=UPI002C1325B2|nr:histidine phosphatase family protein [Dokdonella sp.]
MPRGPPVDLILICHGSTDIAAGICLGQSDPPLSAGGFTDVQRLAAGWDGPAPRFLFSSDLRRAQQSAQVFAARFAIEPLADARLREVDFGRWDGRRWDEIVKQDAQRHAHWLENWVIQEAPDGESFADVLRRTGAWLAALLGSTGRDDCVLALAHPGSIRALLCHALGLPPGRAMAIGIDEARVSRLRYGNGQFEVRYINTTRFERD